MFAVSGTRQTNTPVGTVADFCPTCRDARPFTLIRVGKVSHFYYLSIGKGHLVCHHRKCSVCGVLLHAEYSRYREVVKRPGNIALEELVSRTMPDLRRVHAQRLQIEDAIRKNPQALEPGLRAHLLAEPFHLLEPIMKKRADSISVDWLMLLVLFVALMVLPPIYADLSSSHPALADYASPMALVDLALTGVALFVLSRRAGRRYMSKKIYPTVANALRPLDPRETELDSILVPLRDAKQAMATYVHLGELMKAIESR